MSLRLTELKPGDFARIIDVVTPMGRTDIAVDALMRLEELGFLPGETIQLVRRGPGGDPLACRVGNALFALRQLEASAILVEPQHV